MPSLLERLFGKKTETKTQETAQKVSEEAARLRREALEAEKKAQEAARAASAEAEKARVATLEAAKQAEAKATEAAKEAQAKAVEAAKAAGLVVTGGEKTYVVKSGDSLSKIAKELLGDAKRWPEIYEANKALIGDNPNLIHPGQKLIIK